MNLYEDEKFELLMNEITDMMGYLIMDIILMSLKKINSEDQIYKEFLEARLEVKIENQPVR